MGRRKNAFQHWLERDLLNRFEEWILLLDLDMVLEWGLVNAANESLDKPAPVVDALLAVTEIVRSLTLVTRNDKDFSGEVLNLLSHR